MRDPQVRPPFEDDAIVDRRTDGPDRRHVGSSALSKDPGVRSPRPRRRLLNLFPESALQPELPATPSGPQLVFQSRVAATQPDAAAPFDSRQRATPTTEDQRSTSSMDFPTPSRRVPCERAKDELLVAIRSCRGLVVLTGPAGTGQSNLCREVSQELDRRTLAAVAHAPKSFDDLLMMVLVDFGVMTIESADRAGVPRPRLAAALHSFLGSLASLHARAVVFIDDADRVPAAVLAEMPALSAQSDAGMLQLVLIGRPELTQLLERPALRDVDASVAVRLELESSRAPDAPSETPQTSTIVERSPIVDVPPIESIAIDLESGHPRQSRPGRLLIIVAAVSIVLAGAGALLWVVLIP